MTATRTSLAALVATLTAAREHAGISQRDLARRLGIAHATLAQWETGQRTPAADALIAWAHALGIDLVPLTPRERDAYARGHADGWAACANAVADAVADALVPALTARPDHTTGA